MIIANSTTNITWRKLFSTVCLTIYISIPKNVTAMIACPLGKLNPRTAFNRGANGRFLRKRFFNISINARLLKAIAPTRIENQVCLRINKKKKINKRFAGIRNWCLPRKVMNNINLFIAFDVHLSNVSNMARSLGLYLLTCGLTIKTKIEIRAVKSKSEITIPAVTSAALSQKPVY